MVGQLTATGENLNNIDWGSLSSAVKSLQGAGPEAATGADNDNNDDEEIIEVPAPRHPDPVKTETHTADPFDAFSEAELLELVKNFKQLEKNEQKDLVAYMKRLEARDPEKVKKLKRSLYM